MDNLQKEIKQLIKDAKTHDDINMTSAKLANHFVKLMGNINADLNFHPNGNLLICFRSKYTILTMLVIPTNYIGCAYCVPNIGISKRWKFSFSLSSKSKDIPCEIKKLMESFGDES